MPAREELGDNYITEEDGQGRFIIRDRTKGALFRYDRTNDVLDVVKPITELDTDDLSAAAQFVAPWIARSDTLDRVLGGFAQSFVYAIKGAAASAVLLVAATPAYLVLTADPGTRQVAAKWVGIALGGYLALNVVGWLADRAVTAYIHAHPHAEEWADLWPDEEELDDD